MTEQEWLNSTDAMRMLEFLQDRASDRKLRLFACACSRSVWSSLTTHRSRRAVKIAERYADGAASDQELLRAYSMALDAAYTVQAQNCHRRFVQPDLASERRLFFAAQTAQPHKPFLMGRLHWFQWDDSMQTHYPGMLRCIFGPLPFRIMSLDPELLEWKDRTVSRIATAIY